MKLNLGNVATGLEDLNKRVNKEDKKPHDACAAIITKSNEDGEIQYLCQWHLKFQQITFPIGKVKGDQGIVEGLIVEMKEELAIEVENFMEILQYHKEYETNGVMVPVNTHVFKIIKFKGEPKNVEKEKHGWLKWLTRKEIEESQKKKGDCVTRYFAWLDDINNPSLIKPHVVVGMGK